MSGDAPNFKLHANAPAVNCCANVVCVHEAERAVGTLIWPPLQIGGRMHTNVEGWWATNLGI